MFIHYDDRTKQRLRKLNVNLTDTESQASSIKDISYKLLAIIDTLLKDRVQASKDAAASKGGEDGGSKRSTKDNWNDDKRLSRYRRNKNEGDS